MKKYIIRIAVFLLKCIIAILFVVGASIYLLSKLIRSFSYLLLLDTRSAKDEFIDFWTIETTF